MIIYTFCVDIGKYSKDQLTTAAFIFLSALEQSRTDIRRLVILSNFQLALPSAPFSVDIRKYNNLHPSVYGDNEWANLNLNKLSYYEILSREFGASPVWIDLDTVVLRNLDHLDSLPNFFIVKGGIDDGSTYPLLASQPLYCIPVCKYLNGSVFKLDASIYHAVVGIVKQYRDSIIYSEQGALNIVYFSPDRQFPMYVLGDNVDIQTLNSYSAWEQKPGSHPCATHAKNLYLDLRGNVRSRFYPGKVVQFLSLTFQAHVELYNMKPYHNFFSWYLHRLYRLKTLPRWRSHLVSGCNYCYLLIAGSLWRMRVALNLKRRVIVAFRALLFRKLP